MKGGKAENALNTTFKSCRTCSHTGSSGQTAGAGVPMFSSKPHGAHGALEKTKKCRHPGSEEEPQQQTSRRPKRQFPAFEIHGITFISFSLLPLMFFFSLPCIHDTRATYVGGLRCAGFPSLCLSPHSLSRWGVSTTFPSYFTSSVFFIETNQRHKSLKNLMDTL